MGHGGAEFSNAVRSRGVVLEEPDRQWVDREETDQVGAKLRSPGV